MTQKLRQLEISNNKLSDIDGVVVSHLTELRVLNLDFNQITKLSAEVMFLYLYVKCTVCYKQGIMNGL